MNQIIDIVKAITTKDPAIISGLFKRLVDKSDRDSVRELLTEAMVTIDIEKITENPHGGFLCDILRGQGWRGYDNLSYLELIGEFEAHDETIEILFLPTDYNIEEQNRLFELIGKAANLY